MNEAAAVFLFGTMVLFGALIMGKSCAAEIRCTSCSFDVPARDCNIYCMETK